MIEIDGGKSYLQRRPTKGCKATDKKKAEHRVVVVKEEMGEDNKWLILRLFLFFSCLIII